MQGVDGVRPASGENSDAVVRVTSLSKRYGRTVALDGIDPAIRPNELFAPLGPNGGLPGAAARGTRPTHDIEEVEGCDRICVIDRGRLLAVDTPAALKVAH